MCAMTRREFVDRSIQGAAVAAAGAATFGAPTVLPARSLEDRAVLALIGAGGRGQMVISGMTRSKNVKVKYVCDVNQACGDNIVRDLEKVQGRAPSRVAEIRRVLDDKDVHGVVVATPEHWHALATVWACQAGKDVFVEKNISLSIWEGRKMIEAARKYQRIVQAGFQNRSAPYAFSAREYIRNGGLGKVLFVQVYSMLPTTYGGYPVQREPDSDPPAGLDWDAWLGPAPIRPFNRNLLTQWYGSWDLSGGSLAADGSHTLDLARMVLGDPPHPREVHSVGGRFQFHDGGAIPDVQILGYQYDQFAMTCLNTGFTPYIIKSPPEVRYGNKWPHWPQNSERIEIFGTKRMMYLGRHGGGWQVIEGNGWPKIVAQEKGYFPDKWHQANFVDCIRSRTQPNGDIEQAHYSACLVHLGNIAYRTGNQKLVFDGKTETFVGSGEANRYLKPSYRKHYRIPEAV